MEALECRRLFTAAAATPITPLASAPWSGNAKLIRQDLETKQHPTITGAGQSIAVIDTGIDYLHPFLGGGFGAGYKVVAGYDFVDDDSDPMDTFGHGTDVAGVLAASPFTADGVRYSGIAPDANLIALRVDAANDPVPDDRIERALRWVINNQATYNIVSVNISFGSGHFGGTHTSSYSDELLTLKNMNVVVCAASGNEGVSTPFGIEYPAADPSVISVGSVDQFDTISEFTERGSNLDLLAPGEDVETTSVGPEDFETVSGTSFATPMVAGAVALMRQANPNLHFSDVNSIFHAGSKENLDGDSEFGAVTNLTFQRLDLLDCVNLSLARRAGPLGATGEVATAGNGNDLAYDADGVLHMAYYDSINHTLMYVTRCSDHGLSDATRIDLSTDDVGGFVSLAVDKYDRPAVAYFDGTAGDLRYAHFNGETWDVQTIDSKGSVGLYPSLLFDASGNPVISYFQKTRGDLRVARFDGTQWNIQTVDATGVVGRSTDLALDKKTGELAIAYEDSGRGRLKVARNSGAGWTRGVADGQTHGVTHTSIAFDPNDDPAISYYDIFNADLKYAEFNGAGWTIQRLANKGAQGLYTQLYFTDDGNANILYYNRKGNSVVKLTGTIDTGWAASVLQSTGGRYIAAAEDPLDGHVTYSWFEPGVAKLRVADL